MVPYHCLGCIWSQRDKKGKEHLAPTVRATVTQFNSVANCVITTCLGDRSVSARHRARVVEHWIEVARVGIPSRARAPTPFHPGIEFRPSAWRGCVTHRAVRAPPRASVSSGRELPAERDPSWSRQAGSPSWPVPLPPRSAGSSRISPPSTPSSLPCRATPSTG